MNRPKYKESQIPEHLYPYVRYTKGLPGTPWGTTCILRDKETNEEVARANAFCSDKDQPVRKIGRAIAVGRALKQYHDEHTAAQI